MVTRAVVGQVAKRVAGLALGGGSAFVELAFLVVGLPALLVAPAGVHRVARWLVEFERGRISRFHGPAIVGECTGERAMRYLGVRWLIGGLGAGILLLIVFGAATAVVMVAQMIAGGLDDAGQLTWYDPITFVLFGTLVAFITVQGLLGVERLDLAAARRFIGPSRFELLTKRVSELTESRSAVVAAVDAERRRIERDLHDGVQQRLVALGVLLGRARRDRERAGGLLEQAHGLVGRTLVELREVTWRVFPVALDAGGLRPALESLAEMSPLPVDLHCHLDARYSEAVETAAYFVACEAVTNAVKHSGADRIGMEVGMAGSLLVVRVRDDGCGGADPSGGGLSGLARRVAAVDGQFMVDSPVGGPTVVMAMLPCA